MISFVLLCNRLWNFSGVIENVRFCTHHLVSKLLLEIDRSIDGIALISALSTPSGAIWHSRRRRGMSFFVLREFPWTTPTNLTHLLFFLDILSLSRLHCCGTKTVRFQFRFLLLLILTLFLYFSLSLSFSLSRCQNCSTFDIVSVSVQVIACACISSSVCVCVDIEQCEYIHRH